MLRNNADAHISSLGYLCYHLPYISTFVSESAKPDFHGVLWCLLALFSCRDLLGAEEEYSIFFLLSSSAWDSKELAMEITSLNPDFLGESNYM